MSRDDQEAIAFYSKSNDYFEFSNFSPHGFEVEGTYWPTVEHFFQAQKFPDQPDYQEKIRQAPAPAVAKSLGRTRAIPLRADWEDVKETVMLEALHAKFQTHPGLRLLLLETGERLLIEKAPADSYWGSGRTGTGKNRLGVLLMQVRDELRRQASNETGQSPEETDQCGV